MAKMKHEGVAICFPHEITWVVGPPSSGKSTITQHLFEQLNYTTILEMREICNTVVESNGGKFDMNKVVSHFVRTIFTSDPETKLIIDDFVSISCAHVVPLIFHTIKKFQQSEAYKNLPKFRYRICVFTMSQSLCLERQMSKDHSLDVATAVDLCQKFKKRSEQVINYLHSLFSFSVIDANLGIDKVKEIALQEVCDQQNGALRSREQHSYRPPANHFGHMQQQRNYRRGPPPGFESVSPSTTTSNYWRGGPPQPSYMRNEYQYGYESTGQMPSYYLHRNLNVQQMEHYPQPLPVAISNPHRAIISRLNEFLTPVLNIQEVKMDITDMFGSLLGQYLKEMTPRDVSEMGDCPKIRMQYYFQPATALNVYIYITGKSCYLIDVKWNIWILPAMIFPKTDKIILFGKLFHLKEEDKFVFLACDVCSHQTKEYNIDRRSRMIVKVANYLNDQHLPILIRVNLFVPLDAELIQPTRRVRFNDVLLPVTGLIFAAKQSNFLFDSKIPGYIWQFSNRLVSYDFVKKTFLLKNEPEEQRGKNADAPLEESSTKAASENSPQIDQTPPDNSLPQ